MNSLLEFREKLKEFYGDYDVYIRPILRFVLAVISFAAINGNIGYLSQINNIFVILILSVICAILPLNGIVVTGTVLIVANSFGLSAEAGFFALVLYLLMIIVYFRFVPKDALAIILTPAAFYFHVPALVPLSLGLIRGPLSAVTAAFGVVSWSFIHSLPTAIEPLMNARDSSALDIIQAMPAALVTPETLLEIITFVIVLLIVAAIRKLVSGHSWEIGIVTGAVVYMVFKAGGSYFLGLQADILTEALGTAVSVFVCFVLEFFYFSADYSRTEYLQFEDDKNYYYIKVMPKRMPVYSDARIENENQDEIPDDDSSFRERRPEDQISRKFEGINLQSMLEDSLKTLETGGTDGGKTTGEKTASVNGGVRKRNGGNSMAADGAGKFEAPGGDTGDTVVIRRTAGKPDVTPGENPAGGDTVVIKKAGDIFSGSGNEKKSENRSGEASGKGEILTDMAPPPRRKGDR